MTTEPLFSHHKGVLENMTTASTAHLNTPYIAEITLDRDSSVPLYQQILEPMRQLIMAGELEPGRLIEDEISLSQRLNVSRPTARRALQDLVNAGLLTRRRGVGTRVTPTHIHRQIGLTSLNDDLIKAGYQTKTEVLSYQVHLADDKTATALECGEGTEVVTIKRLRWINDSKLAVMTNTIPSEFAPTLTELSQFGLYECFSRRNVTPASAVQTVGAKAADETEAQLLGLAKGAPLMTVERTAFDSSGAIIEYGSHCYDAAQYHVTIPLVSAN